MQAVRHGSGTLSGMDLLILISEQEAEALGSSEVMGHIYREDYAKTNNNRTHFQETPGYPYVIGEEITLAVGKKFSGAKVVDSSNYFICPTMYNMLLENGRISLRYDTHGNTITILNYNRRKDSYRAEIECLGF